MTLVDDATQARRGLLADLRVVWAQFGRQDIFFHAGSVAYSALLAGVPFMLLLASALGYAIGQAPAVSNEVLERFVQQLLPDQTAASALPILRGVLIDVETRRSALGLFGAPLFAVFSTQFFGALRSSLGTVFVVERGHGFFSGKLFDLFYVLVGTVAVTMYLALNAYLGSLGTGIGTTMLGALGFNPNAVGFVEFFLGRLVEVIFLATMFTGLYKFVPNRHVPWESAWWGGIWCAALFEIARTVIFTLVTRFMSPGSLYSGTLAAIVVVVFWAYYAAVIFLIGGVIARVHEVRGTRRAVSAAST